MVARAPITYKVATAESQRFGSHDAGPASHSPVDDGLERPQADGDEQDVDRDQELRPEQRAVEDRATTGSMSCAVPRAPAITIGTMIG